MEAHRDLKAPVTAVLVPMYQRTQAAATRRTNLGPTNRTRPDTSGRMCATGRMSVGRGVAADDTSGELLAGPGSEGLVVALDLPGGLPRERVVLAHFRFRRGPQRMGGDNEAEDRLQTRLVGRDLLDRDDYRPDRPDVHPPSRIAAPGGLLRTVDFLERPQRRCEHGRCHARDRSRIPAAGEPDRLVVRDRRV